MLHSSSFLDLLWWSFKHLSFIFLSLLQGLQCFLFCGFQTLLEPSFLSLFTLHLGWSFISQGSILVLSPRIIILFFNAMVLLSTSSRFFNLKQPQFFYIVAMKFSKLKNGLSSKLRGVVFLFRSISNGIELDLHMVLELGPIFLIILVRLHIGFPPNQSMVCHLRMRKINLIFITKSMDAKIKLQLPQPIVEILCIHSNIIPLDSHHNLNLKRCISIVRLSKEFIKTTKMTLLLISFLLFLLGFSIFEVRFTIILFV